MQSTEVNEGPAEDALNIRNENPVIDSSFLNEQHLFGTTSSRPKASGNRPAEDHKQPSTTNSLVTRLPTRPPIKWGTEIVAFAVMRGCLQLVAPKYSFAIEDENGVPHTFFLPPALREVFRVATLCSSIKDKDALLFGVAWEKHADETTDEMMRKYKHQWRNVLHGALVSQLKEISWAIAGIRSDQMGCFLSLLISVNGGLLPKFYQKQRDMLSALADLLISIESVKDNIFGRIQAFLSHAELMRPSAAIYPMYSKDHAAYIIVLPPVDLSVDGLLTVVFCDGSGANKFHPTKLGEGDNIYRGHCIIQCNEEDLNDILHILATNWKYENFLVENALSRLFSEESARKKFKLRDINSLFHGLDPLFLNQHVYLVQQETENCAFHNLLETLWFTCSRRSDGDSNEDFAQLRYSICETALLLLRERRMEVEKVCQIYGHNYAYGVAEQRLCNALSAQFKYFEEYAGNVTECVEEIQRTHKDKVVIDNAQTNAVAKRAALQTKLMELLRDKEITEEALRACLHDLLGPHVPQVKVDSLIAKWKCLR